MSDGRKPRNGLETRETVLAAAAKVLAEKGFNGSSLAAISEASGISVGLILHHFGSKEELYSVVSRALAERYRRSLMTSTQSAMETGGDVAEAAIEAVFRFWTSDEVYARISLWSYLEGKSGLSAAETATSVGLVGELRKKQAAGAVDARFDPHVLLAMTIGSIHFWNRCRDSFRAQLGLEGGAAKQDEEFLRQYKALVRKLYEPSAASP
jgi:TetR/AcrR family transcriptional regulator